MREELAPVEWKGAARGFRLEAGAGVAIGREAGAVEEGRGGGRGGGELISFWSILKPCLFLLFN
jgi:hypothetical protein